MDPSEFMVSPFPAFLDEVCGGIRRVRVLSSRQGREVFLVEDVAGRLRVFKVSGNLSGSRLEDFLKRRKRIQEGSGSPYLLPLLASGSSGSSGWEELALAEPAEARLAGFDEYTPAQAVDGIAGQSGQSLEFAITVGATVVAALADLASLGLSHGDVKPSNMLRYGGRWVLADYDTVGPTDGVQQITASTEGYVPPGGGGGEERDCYALGKVLYELWTGQSRFEYPTLPEWLIREPWGRRERVLNQFIHSLCAAAGFERLGIPAATTILNALASGDTTALRRSEKVLQARTRSRSKGLGLVAAVVLLGVGLGVGMLRRSSGLMEESWDGEPMVLRVYRNDSALNEGYVRWTTDGGSSRPLLFNAHASLRRPLKTGETLVIQMKKDVWRGHIGLYLSDEPFFEVRKPVFGHRENFGGLNHLLFFHVDGDTLVGPTGWESGRPLAIPKDAWARLNDRASLDTYTVSLEVLEKQYRWTVSVVGEQFAVGHFDRVEGRPVYLNVYTFDNTLCYLGRLSRSVTGQAH
jgi:hypothetical protein